MQRLASNVPELLSGVPAGPRERRIALAVVLVSLAVFAALAPFADRPLKRVPAFIPLYQSALVVIDLVTAALLFAQCRFAPARPLFLLACGYLFTACMTLAHTLTFPGLFAPQGLLGAGMQSTAWLYMFWHALFPVFVTLYALSPPRSVSSRQAAAGIAGVVGLAAALAVLATAGQSWLPPIMAGDGYLPAYHLVVGVVWLCSGLALICLVRKPTRTVLDMWVMVVMCAWICDVALAAVLNAGRFDLGFYAGRIYGLFAASFVLVGLLFETAALHARLAAAGAEQAARIEAEAANRAKDEFLAMLGHELRNPLAPIVTALQIMRMRDANSFAAERLIIERQISHLTRLVDDLLDISRLARGLIDLRLERCEMADVVARAVETATPALTRQRHRLEVDVAPAGLQLDADPARLAQVLANLLANAAKFTPPEGRIRVAAGREGDDIVVRVEDNGAGLTPALQARVFEPFSQGPQSPARVEGGLGLGLAIAKNIVSLHGGTIEVRSEGPGKGAEFLVRLPAGAAKAQISPPALEEEPERGGEARRPVRVLIVDDNVDAATTLAQLLRLEGAEVRVAHDGPEALAIAQRFAPQAALLDLGLPGMDGVALAERLRELPGLSSIRLAAVTGYGQAADRMRTAQAGFDAHFLKPADVNRLLEFVYAEVQA